MRRQSGGVKVFPSLVATLTREDFIETTRHQVFAPIGHLLENGSVFIYPGIISSADKADAIVSCQKWLAAKMQATGCRGVQIAN